MCFVTLLITYEARRNETALAGCDVLRYERGFKALIDDIEAVKHELNVGGVLSV
jgi:hypothetical protein